MTIDTTNRLTAVERLHVPQDVQKDLVTFLEQMTACYHDDLLAVIAFGSAVTGDYVEGISDINLLVIYADLNISDLQVVTKLAQRWLTKRKFAPRFLSQRNLVSSAKYFPIDLLEMRDAYVVLQGEDLLASLTIARPDLRWQLAHDIKNMRMRIKQQFWRTAGDARMMRRILLQRFSSLLHLMRALLFLQHQSPQLSHQAIVAAAVPALHIDPAFAQWMVELKHGAQHPNQQELVHAFEQLMELIRVLDDAIDGLTDA